MTNQADWQESSGAEVPEKERERDEEMIIRLGKENSVMIEIGRIITSTLKIEEVYERFAHEALKIVSFDRVVVNIINPGEATFTHAYVSGIDVPGRRLGDEYAVSGSGVEIVMRTRSPLWSQGEDLAELAHRIPLLMAVHQAGFRSIIIIPLISNDQVIGVLTFLSLKSRAYSQEDVRVAQNIGAQIAGALANARLFADRERAEQALRESEQRYRASEAKYRRLVENASEAIFIIQDDRIKFANPKTLEVLGYSEAEISSIPFSRLLHPEDRCLALARYEERNSGQSIDAIQTCRLLHKSGEEIWGQFNSVPVTWEDRPATLNFVRDVTREKKLETQFHTAQKMEAIGTLAGGIAHDFNNLLMAVQGYISLILFDLDPAHPHYESLKKIEDQVKSGAKLAGQLLAFARRGKYEVKASDLNKILQHTSGIFARTKKEIRIHTDLQEGIWAVEVDRGQVEQALMNLYVNAWQAMPEGGDLYLETRNVRLGPDYTKPFAIQQGNYVRISVRDTGIGMDKATQKRIFEPFFTTREMGRGTGLALASVYGSVKNHGGFINVYSEIGHGTIFRVYFPASDKEIPEERIAPRAIPVGSETVLLIDDEETITEVIGKALTLTGYKVLPAHGGEEALQLYQDNRSSIDVVVLDMIMPGMNGGKVFDRLRDMNKGVKVILSSGYSLEGEASQIMARGCDGFIQKPFGIKELSQKIREVLGKL